MAKFSSESVRRSCGRVLPQAALWVFILLPGLSTAAGADIRPGAQAQEKEKPVATTPAQARPPDGLQQSPEAALDRIGTFRILQRDFEAIFPRRGSKPLVEVVNAFTVRNRGRFYGSVYEYHRNDFFDARNFFDPVGQKLPEFKRNQFGGSLGAHVTHRMQVFGTYDGLRINRGSTITSLVPTPAMRDGDFSGISTTIVDPFTKVAFPGNQIPRHRLHPVALKFLPAVPLPNRGDIYPYFTNNQPSVENADTVTARVDYEFDRQSKLFGNWRFTDDEETNVNPLPEFSTSQQNRSQNLSLAFNRGFGPNLVIDLTASFDRRVELELSGHAFKEGTLAALGIKGLKILDGADEGYPEVSISGYPTLGQSRRFQSPRTSYTNSLNLAANATYVRRSHKFNFGLEVRNTQLNDHRTAGARRGEFEFLGYFSGHAFADFMLGIPASATRGMGSDRADLRQRTWKAYLRDDWKINPRFSLSLSLTYNYFPVAHSLRENVSLFWPLVFEPPLSGQMVVAGSPEADAAGLLGLRPGQAAYPDKNDWQPFVGLAYSPLGNNRLVLRGSYGWSYQMLDVRRTLNFIGRNFPFYWQETASSPATPNLNFSNPFEAAAPSETTIRALDPNVRSSYVQEWQLSIQNEFFRSWNLEVRYEGRKATRTARTIPGNVPLPGAGLIRTRRPNPGFGRFYIGDGGGSSIGHALQVDLRKRLTRGFSLRSSFAWDRTFSDMIMQDPQDPRNLRAERAVSGFMPPLRFTLNYIWDLPVGRDRAIRAAWAGKLRFLLEGWQVSGITRILSGSLIHPQLGGDKNNDGVSGDRPNRIGSGILPPSERSIAKWFATGAFVSPAAYGFGNSGRHILLEPGEMIWDISLIKRTRVSERGDAVELRVQFFNAFNRANFERPGTTLGTSTFGTITNAGESREIEIALKYTF